MIERGMSVANPNSAQFTVTYDGEALRDHEIDVRDLAPALLAVGKLFEDANRVINGDRCDVRVRMKATGEGSIDVALKVHQTLGQQLESILTSPHIQAAINLKDLIGIGVGATAGVLFVLKWLRGRKAKRLDEADGQITLGVDGETLSIASDVVRLMEDVPVRNDIQKMLAPLQNKGIDIFQTKESAGAVPSLEITKEQLAYFDPPKMEEMIVEELPERTWTSAYSIVSLAFKDDNKWRLSDGEAIISASILDKNFLAEVEKDRPFSKGDILICEMKQRQTHTSSGLRSEFDLVRVVEHRRAPRQYKLFD
jgi:hypothetical protein